MLLDSQIKDILDVATRAGDFLKSQFYSPHIITSKSHINDLVTECDQHSEALIKDGLKKAFNGCSFLCEESGLETHNDSLTWIVDPLDGTVNFAKKIPFFCVNLALKLNQDILFALTLSPMTNELFMAQKGKGAFLNGEQIVVSRQNDINRSFGATGFPYKVQNNISISLKPIENLLSKGVPLRRLGSAALDLAYIAAGRFDVFFEAYLEPWDYAAGMLLIQEAGGLISDFQNNCLPITKGSTVLATNGLLHEAMIKEVTV